MQINISQILDYVKKEDVKRYEDSLKEYQKGLLDKTLAGHEFMGWLDLPERMQEDQLAAINDDVQRIAPEADVFVVIGIGGSYLGARAVIEALKHSFEALMPEKRPTVIYAGNNISEKYLSDLLELLDEKDYALTVISKSGTTTEPAIAFRILREHLEAKYGKKTARRRIIAITDKEKGALRQLTNQEGYSSYVVPDDVGGRYSVLTPVGLLPVAMAGVDVRQIIRGAGDMRNQLNNTHTLEDNPAFAYAAARNALYNKGKTTEVMAAFEPALHYFAEWWKQLFGESEGKDAKGIFPASVSFTTDLHSLGQYIQDGERNIIETVLHVENPRKSLNVPEDSANLDKLNYLSGKAIHEINHKAETGTIMAHVDGGVPVIQISIPEINEYHLGQLIFFYEYACALSGYLLGVNPFDQPGVEAYKNNMFALLGKPGFEEKTNEVYNRSSKQ
ncbi:MAG: glucose-6-phosphate isomerase [Bacteroidales bacterium]|nr:glucose-6-phosphate isomerase [Bacteroidales bacterium]MCF8327764.1 glucose-6-phosphate isomerase [Bacteroidales bacterium]